MPGFFVSNQPSHIQLRDRFPEKCVYEEKNFPENGFFLKRNTLHKFMEDKTFTAWGDAFYVLDGYLLNRSELFQRYGAESIPELLDGMCRTKGETFFEEFRGCFSGGVLSLDKKEVCVFTNQIGDCPIFFLEKDGAFCTASEISYILDFCREKRISLTFDQECAYQMLTFGYIADNRTYAKEIKRLHGGDYLVYSEKGVQVKTYHRFTKHPEQFSGKQRQEIIDAIDREFRRAVYLEWRKDREYQYHHLADLSGGLDSRMNLWVAHTLQDLHATVLTYCKAGYLDETIAREIAAYWQDEFHFLPLDGAEFLYDIDENTRMLGGLSLYSGITGGKRFLESLDLAEAGIEHTGMVGDAALGSFFRHPSDGQRHWPSGMYSEKLRSRLSESVKELPEQYYDYEVYLMYVRGFHGACNSHLIRRNYTEVGSPFLNVDFLQLAFDIPVELRIDHSIYKKWIIAKYPEAAKFRWEKTGGRITESPFRTKARKIITKGPNKVRKMLGQHSAIQTGMNPLDYWIASNQELRSYLDSYESEGLRQFRDFYPRDLAQDMDRLYQYGNASEKAMVLTVISSTKLYFGSEDNA